MKTRYFKFYLAGITAILLQLGVSQAIAWDMAYEVDWEAFNPEIKGSEYVNSSEECVECHEDYMQKFAVNKHGINLMQQCESCHGPMSKHLDAPRRKPALVVALSDNGKLTGDQKSSVCLQCHQGGNRMNWPMSTHLAVGNDCTTCHNIDAPTDPVLIKTTQVKVCFECHQDKRAQMFRRSRHPFREGKVICSDCHNPHGSPAHAQLVRNTVNETCYECHQEKRGPFLHEHQPAREDCSLCHNPHGTTQPRLLKVRTPWLCQQCHSEAFHPSTLYSGEGVPPAGAAQQLLGKGCLNCHPKVHGTNHPSGTRLSR